VRRIHYGLLVGSYAVFGLIPAVGQPKLPAAVFRPALDQIQTKIPILLPSKLPSHIREGDIKLALGRTLEDGYFIELYFTESGMNAGFAAGFGGSSRVFHDLVNTRKVTLPGGRRGMFEPVSCGGSCAPANLWWEQDGAMYQIQLKLRSTMKESEQLGILINTVDSVVPVRRE
jgi:hypothetical protein